MGTNVAKPVVSTISFGDRCPLTLGCVALVVTIAPAVIIVIVNATIVESFPLSLQRSSEANPFAKSLCNPTSILSEIHLQIYHPRGFNPEEIN